MRRYLPFFLLLVFACEELPTQQDFPVLRTLSPVQIDENGLTLRGEVIRKGRLATGQFGFAWEVADGSGRNPGVVIVASELSEGPFEVRVEHSFVKGLTYKIRAYATFTKSTTESLVYGNEVEVESLGCRTTAWSLESQGITLAQVQNANVFGASNGTKGYAVFTNRQVFVFDPSANSFETAASFPASGDPFSVIHSAAYLNAAYYYTSINDNIYRHGVQGWSVETQRPFPYSSFFMTQYNSLIYFLGTIGVYAYNPQTKQWQSRSGLPIQGGFIAGGVVVGTKALVVTSSGAVWEYDFTASSWTYKTFFPAQVKSGIAAFALASGRIFMGLPSAEYTSESNWFDPRMWTYDPTTDAWEEVESFPLRLDAGDLFHFFIEDQLYVGHGKPGYQTFSLWRFDPQRLYPDPG